MAKTRTLKSTRKFNGKAYRKAGTSRLKSDAKKRATSARTSGKSARVAKTAKGYTVYTRG